MINIGQFKDLLRCTSKDVYSMNEAELQRTFNSMAKFLLNKCVIIVTHSQNVCDMVDKVYDLKKEIVNN